MRDTRRTASTLVLIGGLTLAACGTNAADSSPSSASPRAAAASSLPVTPAFSASSTNQHAAFTVKEFDSFDSTSDSGWTATFQVLSSPAANILVDPGM